MEPFSLLIEKSFSVNRYKKTAAVLKQTLWEKAFKVCRFSFHSGLYPPLKRIVKKREILYNKGKQQSDAFFPEPYIRSLQERKEQTKQMF